MSGVGCEQADNPARRTARAMYLAKVDRVYQDALKILGRKSLSVGAMQLSLGESYSVLTSVEANHTLDPL